MIEQGGYTFESERDQSSPKNNTEQSPIRTSKSPLRENMDINASRDSDMFGEIRIMENFKGKNFPSPKVTAINKWTMNNS